MRTSHIQIRKRINEAKSKITDRELFMSPAYSAYLTDITEAASKRYKQTVKIFMYWDENENAKIASTDNNNIVINAGNYLTHSFPSRPLRADSLIGLDAHEVGHLLYTDFTMLDKFLRAYESGRMYPSEPTSLNAEDESSMAEIRDIFASKNANAIKIICKTAHKISNILEDIFIEARMCEEFPGTFRTGILLNSLKMTELIQPVTEQIKDGLHGLAIMTNLLLHYCRSGKINNPDGYSGEYLDSLSECIPVADSAVYDDDIKTRFNAANLIVVKLWKYIKPLLDKVSGDDGQQKGGSNGNNGSGSGDASDILDKILSDLDNQILSIGSDPIGKGKPVDSDEFQIDKKMLDKLKEEIQDLYEQILSSLEPEETDSIDEGDNGGVTRNNGYESSGMRSTADDMNRILTNIAENTVNTALEKELIVGLRAESKRIRYGNAHKGIHVTVNRMRAIPDYLIRSYKAVSPPLLMLSKRMQKQIEQVLKDRREGGRQTGLITGKRLNARTLVNNDGRYFYNTRLPQEQQELAVAVLVDESGSMRLDNRIDTARAASIVIYDFCTKLNIPVIIYGHTTAENDKDVNLYAYAEFDSQDKNDMYRLMDMSFRNRNRDGAALRFVSERLVKRPEEIKLLFLISDGQPSAEGYSGTEAEADLRGIKHEYKKKGVITIAAAIGSDKENIKRIYGDGYLDITDLNRLPSNLTSLISKYIKNNL